MEDKTKEQIEAMFEKQRKCKHPRTIRGAKRNVIFCESCGKEILF